MILNMWSGHAQVKELTLKIAPRLAISLVDINSKKQKQKQPPPTHTHKKKKTSGRILA